MDKNGIFVRRDRAIPKRIRNAVMYVGGEYGGQVYLVEEDHERFENLLGVFWDWEPMYSNVGRGLRMFAHRKWADGMWGIDGQNSEHCFPAPRAHERWLCNLVYVETADAYIATPIEFVRSGM